MMARAAFAGLVLAALATGCAHGGVRAKAPDDGDWIVVRHLTVYTQKGDTDCGPAALATLLSRWGIAPETALRGTSAAQDDGVTAGALRDVARKLGFHSFVVQGSFADLDFELERDRPVLVGLVQTSGGQRWSHFVVVVGREVGGGRWLLADPARGLEVIARGALDGQWAASGFVTLVLAPRADRPFPAAPEVSASL
jgi:predicted double-glycine peptidase